MIYLFKHSLIIKQAGFAHDTGSEGEVATHIAVIERQSSFMQRAIEMLSRHRPQIRQMADNLQNQYMLYSWHYDV
jgi:hypothetical protein